MLTGAIGGTPFGEDRSLRRADVLAELEAEAPFELLDDDPRETAVPVLEPSGATREGGGVRTGIGGGDGGGGGDDSELEPPLDPEPDEPELEDPELEDPELDPEDPEPRGTACAQTEAGTARANVRRKQGRMRWNLVIIAPYGITCSCSNCT